MMKLRSANEESEDGEENIRSAFIHQHVRPSSAQLEQRTLLNANASSRGRRLVHAFRRELAIIISDIALHYFWQRDIADLIRGAVGGLYGGEGVARVSDHGHAANLSETER